MKLVKYDSYEAYLEAQKKEASKGIADQSVWSTDATLQAVADYINEHIPDAKQGLCHGVRLGVEVSTLKNLTGADVIGTELCEDAKDIPDVIIHDFHVVKPEWVDSIDFIYSNSLDHTIRPRECMDRWMSCIKQDGVCFIEWCKWDSDENEGSMSHVDCFAASAEEYRKIFNAGWQVVDELTTYQKMQDRGPTTIFCIKHKDQ